MLKNKKLLILLTIVVLATSCDKIKLPSKIKETEYDRQAEVEITFEDSNIAESEESTASEVKREETTKPKEQDLKLFDDVVSKNIEIVGGVKYTLTEPNKEVYYERTTEATERPFNPEEGIGNSYKYDNWIKLSYGNRKWNDLYILNGDMVEYKDIEEPWIYNYLLENVEDKNVIWVLSRTRVQSDSTSELLQETRSTVESSEETTEDGFFVRSTIKRETQGTTSKVSFEDFDDVEFKETTTRKRENESDPNILTYEQKYPYLYNFKFETKKVETIRQTTSRVSNIETKSNSSSIAKNISEGTTGNTTVALQANQKKAKLFNVADYTIKANSATEVMYVNTKDNSQYMSLSFGSNAILLSKIQNKSRLKSIYGTGMISLVDPTTLSSSYAMEIKEYTFQPDNSSERIFSHAIMKIDNATSVLILNESGMKDGLKLATNILKNLEVSMK